MSFTLRIYLLGLLALVPDENGRGMTVLLLDAREGIHQKGVLDIPPHRPILLARSEHCEGECWLATQACEVATFLSESPSKLRQDLKQGGFWLLDNEHLTISSGSKSPRPALEIALNEAAEGAEKGRSWVARMDQLLPGGGQIDPQWLGESPPAGRIVARLKLDRGKLEPYRFITYQESGQEPPAKPVPLVFKTADGRQAASLPAQPFADWLVVEIPVVGSHVEIAATSWQPAQKTRRMKLLPAQASPANSSQEKPRVIEIALLNLPQESFEPAARQNGDTIASPIGQHFALYYDLLQTRPNGNPLLPQVSSRASKSEPLPTASVITSELLSVIGLQSRGSYSTPICPVVVLAPPEDTEAMEMGEPAESQEHK